MKDFYEKRIKDYESWKKKLETEESSFKEMISYMRDQRDSHSSSQ